MSCKDVVTTTQSILGGCLVFDKKILYREKENIILSQYLVNTNMQYIFEYK
jgi:hypothetical protein